jgi:hypothetical protein
MKHFCDYSVNPEKFSRNGRIFRNKAYEFDVISRCNGSGTNSNIDAMSSLAN